MREYHVLSAMVTEAPRNLGRRISRRLSMSVAKVPTFIQSKFRTDVDVADFSASGGGVTNNNGQWWPQQLRRSRPVTLHIILPNGIERTITYAGKCTVRQAVQSVALELHICEFRLRMSDTLAIVSPAAEVSLLDGDTVLLEDATRVRDERGETDARFRLTEDLVDAEREFLISLRTIYDIYARPLRKLCSISDEEQKQLFGGIEPILSVSNMLLTKLEDALAAWDPHETKIGSLFSKQFWNQFDDYFRFFTHAKELLREKQCRDEEFIEICKLRQGAALHTIDSLLDLPIQRLASYERYFQDLLCETGADHPDLDDVHKARDKAQELVKRCEEEINQLDRVQNLFPNDQLYLHDKDALSLKMKGLIRKRSTTAARLQRAFSAKSLRTAASNPTAVSVTPSGSNGSPGGIEMGADSPAVHPSPSLATTPNANHKTPVEKEKRQFIMETSVQFINGLQSRDRHLFLFNDLLLIAKARSGGHFKLKDKVRISELWLSTAIEEVAEGSAGKSRDTSFVIGWPPSVNLVATFSSAALRDLWWNRLGQAVKDERDKEPKTTTIQITYHDAVQAIGYTKTLSVSPTETVRDVIKLALSHLEMSGTADINSFRLWLKTGGSAGGALTSTSIDSDSSPYPLIGHELPFAIKMNCLREYIGRSAVDNDNSMHMESNGNGLSMPIDMLDHCNNIYNADPAARCQFILRSVQKPSFNGSVLGNAKQVVATKTNGAGGAGKAKKSPTRIQKVFRRVQSKPDSLETIGAANPTSPTLLAAAKAGAFFGQPLAKIFAQADHLPQPIMDMLLELRAKGPHTVGIFRKSANARQVREIRERIDANGSRMDWSGVNAVVTAVVFKDFLRSLPDSLLCSGMYDQWLQVAAMDGQDSALDKIKGLCDRLPSANVTLLRHFLCVLLHIVANSSHNMMSASNLAVCVGPSLLWAPASAANASAAAAALNPALALSAEATASKQVPALVAVLIDKCSILFGAETANLLNDKPPVATSAAEAQNSRRVSCNTNGVTTNGHSRSRQAPVQKHMARQGLMQHDSGNEESDSLHSLYHSDVMRRDDSSIDSLERELLSDGLEHDHHHVHSMHLRRDKMSVTNLSRDSGLTLSDTQLYTPDEDMEEGSESSSSGRGSDRDKSRNGVVQMRSRSTTASATIVSSRMDQTRSLYAVPSIRNGDKNGIQNGSIRLLDSYGKLNGGPSSYTPVYNHSRPDAVYRKMSDDAVYAVPKATPTVVLGEEYQSSGSHFQRQDWFRRKSHNRKQSGGVKFDSPPMSGMMLRRSASDESLANVNQSSEIHYHQNYKKPAAHRKGRAPAPPVGSRMAMDCMELSRRSKSDANLDLDGLRFYVDEPDRRANGHKSPSRSGGSIRPSHSTPHITAEEQASTADRSYDSSTLSDDDSTPHVSRSNSRGSKDYRAVNSAWESTYGALTVPVPAPIHIIVSQDGMGSIVYPSNGTPSTKHSSRMSSASTNSSSRMTTTSTPHHEHRSRQAERRPVVSCVPASGGGGGGGGGSSSRSSHYAATPPSGSSRYADYDTVIYASNGGRRSREQRSEDTSLYSVHSNGSGSLSGTPDIPSYEEAMMSRRQRHQGTPVTGGTNWTTWKEKSNNNNSLIQVRASPIRLNGQQTEESGWDADGHTPPPLPPKSDPIPPLPPKQKIHLRSNNPVRMRISNAAQSPSSSRTRPVTIHMDASILSSLDGSGTSSPTQPPSLPRKERIRGNNVSVVSIENSYTPLHRSFAFSTHNLRTAMENNAGREDWTSTKEDDQEGEVSDQERRVDQEIQTSGHWAQFCEIETQTSLSPQPSLTPSGSSADEAPPAKLTVGRYEKNTRGVNNRRREVAVETERSRPRTKDSSTGRDGLGLHRSHSLPPLDKVSSEDGSDDDDEDVEDVEEEKQDFASQPQQQTPSSATSQALRRAEISWSVSQLRALFNGDSSVSSGSSIPPPYRSPPAHQQQQQTRQRSESTDSYGEESYV